MRDDARFSLCTFTPTYARVSNEKDRCHKGRFAHQCASLAALYRARRGSARRSDSQRTDAVIYVQSSLHHEVVGKGLFDLEDDSHGPLRRRKARDFWPENVDF